MRTRIHEFLDERDINHLCHFTLSENIGSILKHGLLPRTMLEQRNLPYFFTDSWRLDGDLGALSLSIESYNYPMLRKKRKEDPGATWIVLIIDPCILAGANARYCPTNAASRDVRYGNRRSINSFIEMFQERHILNNPLQPLAREGLGLPSYIPSDPQAEIQFFGRIDPMHIMGAVCFEERAAEILQADFDTLADRERKAYYLPFQARWLSAEGGYGAIFQDD